MVLVLQRGVQDLGSTGSAEFGVEDIRLWAVVMVSSELCLGARHRLSSLGAFEPLVVLVAGREGGTWSNRF